MSGRFTQLQARLDEEASVISENTVQSVRTALEAVEADAQTAAEIVSQLREGNKKVGERVEVVVKVQMKDVFQKVESAVKKELLRFAESVARDVEVVDPDNEALQAQLQQIVAQQLPALLSFGLSLEVALSEYQSNVAQKAQSLYHQFVHTAEMSLSDTFDGRFNAIEEELDAAASSKSKKPVVPKHEVEKEKTPVEEVHEQPPAPEPRRQSVTAPRPVTVIPVPSEPPSRPPAVPSRPRPASSIAASNAEAAAPSLPQIAPQSPIDLDLAVASNDDASVPSEIDSAKPPPVQARNIGLMGDLNRMLAGGPPKKTHGISVDVAAEENPEMDGNTPRSPLYTSAPVEAPAHANDDEPIPKEDAETDAVASISHDGQDVLPGSSEAPSSTSVSPTSGPPPVTPSPAAVASAHNSANSLAYVPPKRASGTHADIAHASTTQPNASGPEKKKSFMGMLSSLTKSRPKAARAMGKKGDTEADKHKDENEPTTSSDAIAAPNDSTEEEPSVKIEHLEPPTVQIQEPTPIASVPAEILEKEDFQSELVIPTSPVDSPPVSPTTEPAAIPPRPPVPVPRRPVPAPPSESRTSIASDPRRSGVEADSKVASSEEISTSAHSIHSGPAPPPRPRPAPRPESSIRPSSSVSQSASSIHEQPVAHNESSDLSASVALPSQAIEDPSPSHSTTTAPESEVADVPARPLVPPKPPPKKIPGIFANQRGHNAMAALASAMNSRLSGSQSQEEGLDKGSDNADAPALSTEGENDETAQASAVPVHMSAEGLVPPRRPSEPQHDPFPQVKLNIKRADNSNSGDDKAIEKHALEWMNQHLASKDIQIDDLFSSLGNGLNLIYALEDATGETVGKYNKRAMLPVHKIDNIAVALNFISKKGINTGFISPQDMMDGNKSKILTLFNYITKKF
ncbi:hypothetical protein HDU78_005842 [Chytriomyces hyalinus]|nr:hypothetical protein HDU78_005842 [Chytriomyces hyalinus]